MTESGVSPPVGGGELGSNPFRLAAVEEVVRALRERPGRPFSLAQMAALAHLSPYHFHRVFRQETGVPPGRFLRAVRMETAKRLLLATDRSVLDICLDVGYQSPGTFTLQFSSLVGASPRRFRAFCRAPSAATTGVARPCAHHAAVATLSGHVRSSDPDVVHALVACFPSGLPEGQPAACALVEVPGRYELRLSRAGTYGVLALGCRALEELWAPLVAADVQVASAWAPAATASPQPSDSIDLSLRARRPADPPVLIAPGLLADQAASPEATAEPVAAPVGPSAGP